MQQQLQNKTRSPEQKRQPWQSIVTQRAKYIGDIISYDHVANDYMMGKMESQYLDTEEIEEQRLEEMEMEESGELEEGERVSPNTIC